MSGEIVNLSPYALWPLVIGLIAIGVLWIIYGKIAEDFKLKKLLEGAGRKSKFIKAATDSLDSKNILSRGGKTWQILKPILLTIQLGIRSR